MRTASSLVTLGVAFALSVGAAFGGATQARADLPPNVQSINVYRSSFSPTIMSDPSGVTVTLVNRDLISHHIVVYRSSTRWLDIDLAGGARYTLDPLICSTGCYNMRYTFTDAERSYVWDGYCYSVCARLDVYNNGT